MNILKWKGLDVDPMKIHESVTTKPTVGQIDVAFNESTGEGGLSVLYPKIEAIHEGRTRNFNRYPAEKLKGSHELRSGVYSWTQPYPKPVIFNHDENTECTGRVYSASFNEITSVGRPGIIVTPKITHEKTIKDILDGRLLTVSIGASTNAAICSVCHTDIINEGYCGHMRGEEFDGQMVEWICGDLFFDELSWVNVPADSDAMVIATNTNSNSSLLTSEKVVVKNISESSEKEDNVVTDTKTVVEETTATEETVTETSETSVQEELETKTTVEETVADEQAEETVTEEEAKEAEEETKEESATEETVPAEDVTVTAEALATAEAALQDAEASIEELKEANEKLAKELHETVLGFLVDLRMAHGKETNREEALAKFSTRSIESLKDSISDNLTESRPAVARTVERVAKPAGKPISDSKTLATSESKVISNEDVFYNLLNGIK